MSTRFGIRITVIVLAMVLVLAAGVAIARPSMRANSAAVPSMVSYQGKVTQGGIPYSGIGYMKFAVVDTGATTTYWSNDDSSTSGSEPDEAIALTVSNGVFTVLLGDTNLDNMTVPLSAGVFDSADRHLRVWFSSDGTNFTLLAPDQRIAAVPYALQSVNADLLDGQDSSAFQPYESTMYYPLLQPQVVDMTEVYSVLKGYVGGFTDGRYGYLVPFNNGSNHFGVVARLDLNNFTSSGITYLDLSTVNSGLKGFHGGFTDGRYGYFVPYYNGVQMSGLVARLDLQDFSTSGISVLDLSSLGLRSYYGGFTDGRYGYLVPVDDKNGEINPGILVRIDLQNFSSSGVTTLNLTDVDSRLDSFISGFTDGRYAYLAPLDGLVTRVDLQNFTTDGVEILDLTQINSALLDYVGGFTDGRYAYLVPYWVTWHGNLVRIDLQNFSPTGVTVLNLGAIESELVAFSGGFTDGKYAYLVPSMTGKVARVDLQNFSPQGVSWINISAYDATLRGFWGGFSDGRFGYLVPYYYNDNGLVWHGKVPRIPLFFGGGAP